MKGELPPTFKNWPTERRVEYLRMAKDRETLLTWALAAAGRERERSVPRMDKEELAIVIERLWRYEGK